MPRHRRQASERQRAEQEAEVTQRDVAEAAGDEEIEDDPRQPAGDDVRADARGDRDEDARGDLDDSDEVAWRPTRCRG